MGCPCPAIATMINHSCLTPLDENDPIPFFQLVKALRTCYNLSLPFAFLFVLAANLRLGTIRTGGLSIKHLQKHGVIEHDASITRYNANEGDHLNPQNELIDQFIDGIHHPPKLDDDEKMITLQDFANKKMELEDKLTTFLPQQPKSRIHLLGIGESSLALLAFEDKSSPLAKNEICARAQWLRIWFKEERFPWELGWENQRPEYKITLCRLLRTALKFSKAMKQTGKKNK